MGVILTWTLHEELGEKAKIISKQKISEEWKVMLDTFAKAEVMVVRGCSYITKYNFGVLEDAPSEGGPSPPPPM